MSANLKQSNVSPSDTSFNIADIFLADAKHRSYCGLGVLTNSGEISYFNDLSDRELMLTMMLTMWCFSSSLFHAIIGIVLMISKKQMVGVYASSIIAFVKDEYVGWLNSSSQKPTHSMGLKGFNSTVLPNSMATVPKFIFGSNPIPTFSNNFNVRWQLPVFLNSIKEVRDLLCCKFLNVCSFHLVNAFFHRLRAADRACSLVLAFAFPRAAMPPILPNATACLFFIPNYSAIACACKGGLF